MSGREVAAVTLLHQPAHLPKVPVNPAAYERLYAFNGRVDDFLDNDATWQENRIRPRLTEAEVYRLLPCASGFEYGGYLTKTRIRFIKCDPTKANMPMSKACTFHSHPTDLATADIPSASDVFQFLNYRHVRAITVGSTRIWVWDKTKATLGTVKKLGVWAEANMLNEVRRLEKKFPNAWHDPYMKLALKQLGLDWPKKLTDWQAHSEEMLQNLLRINVRVFPRNFGATAR
jgi:hypothetical protein